MFSSSKLKYALDVAAVVIGTITGTVSICGLVPDWWGVVGWVTSIVSAVRLFSARRRVFDPHCERESRPPSIVLRISLAGLAVFCLVFLAALGTACAANPPICGRIERLLASILLIVGTTSAAIATRLVWK
jgi:hypothetical protein